MRRTVEMLISSAAVRTRRDLLVLPFACYATPRHGTSSRRETRRAMAMIETLGIIGAGTMGNGIAQVCAAAGVPVTMIDISDAAVARGLAAVGSSLDRLVKKET